MRATFLQKIVAVILCMCAVLFSAPVFVFATAGIPNIISYQGRLTNSSGVLLGGAGTLYQFKFSIWDSPTVGAGTKLWPASAPGVSTIQVVDGVFNVSIGDTANGYPDPLTYNFQDSNESYLQIEVSADAVTFETLGPRQRIASSSTAINAQTLQGLIPGTGANNILKLGSNGEITLSGGGTSTLGNVSLGTVSTGTWQGDVIADQYITKTGNWSGTFGGQNAGYYLDAANLTNFSTPFTTAFSTKTTDDLVQGSTNKYYSTSLFNTDLATKSTSNLAEGSNLYFTNGRAQAALAGLYEVPLTFTGPLSRSVNTISLDQATGSTDGYLSSTDWNIFNNKQDALPIYTLGSILFGDNSSTPAEDNTNFFWDTVTKKLGIGTNVPAAKLDVVTTYASGDAPLRAGVIGSNAINYDLLWQGSDGYLTSNSVYDDGSGTVNLFSKVESTKNGDFYLRGYTNYGNPAYGNDTFAVSANGAITNYGNLNDGNGNTYQFQKLYSGANGQFNITGLGYDNNGNAQNGDTFSISNTGVLNLTSNIFNSSAGYVQNTTLYIDQNGNLTKWGIYDDSNGSVSQIQNLYSGSDGQFVLGGRQNFGNGIGSSDTLNIDNNGGLALQTASNDGSNNIYNFVPFEISNEGSFYIRSKGAIATSNFDRFTIDTNQDVVDAKFQNARLVLESTDVNQNSTGLVLRNTLSAADSRNWAFQTTDDSLHARLWDDTLSTSYDWMTVSSHGGSVQNITFHNPNDFIIDSSRVQSRTIIPIDDDAYLLGDGSHRWANISATNASIDNVNVTTINGIAYAPYTAPSGTTLQYIRGDGSLATLNSTAVPEGTNLYFSNSRAIGSTLTGYTSGAGTISSSDSVLSAIQKLDGNTAAKFTLPSLTAGSVLFSDGTTIAQDNSNFFYNSATHNLAIGANTFDATNPEKFLVNAGVTTSVNAIAAKGSINSYLQLNIQNQSSGTSASSDIVATADNGSETTNYIDMGINGSSYSGGAFGGANDAYLYNLGQNLLVGTGTAGKSLVFMTGGTSQATNERMRIDGNGNVGIGATSPSWKLTVRGTPAAALGDTSAVARFRNDITTTASAPAYVVAVNRQNSDTAAWYLGNDGNNNAIFATNNAVMRLGKDLSGSFSEYMRIDTSGNVGIGTTAPSSLLDLTTNSLGTTQTQTSGLALVNTTAAAAGAQQISPAVRWSGQGWQTSNSTSQQVDFRAYVLPIQGSSSSPTGTLLFQNQYNNGGYSNLAGFTTVGGTPTFALYNGASQAVTLSAGNRSDFNLNGAYFTSRGSGNVVFGSSALDINSYANGSGIISVSTTQGQFSAMYDNSNYFKTTVGSTGKTTLAVTGSSPNLVLTGGNVGIAIAYPQSFFNASQLQYNTGTASQSGQTITGSGTTFTSAMIGSQFIFADGTSAGYIQNVTSGTSATVSVSQTVSSQAYTISYQGLRGNKNNWAIGSDPSGNNGPFFKVGGPLVRNQWSITGGNLYTTLTAGFDSGTNTDGDGSLASFSNSSNSATSGAVRFIRSNPSGAAGSGWQLGEISTYGGITASTYTDRNASIRFFASQTQSSSAAGSYMTFSTTTNNTTTLSERMRIGNDGNVGIGTTGATSLLQVNQSTTGIGTVSNSAGGTTVTGFGTQFTNTFKVGDSITIGGQTVTISAIASDTSMTTAAITNANTNAAYTLTGGARFSVKGGGPVIVGGSTYVNGMYNSVPSLYVNGYTLFGSTVELPGTVRVTSSATTFRIGQESQRSQGNSLYNTGADTTGIYFGNYLSNPVRIQVGNADKVSVFNTGNMSIGTTSDNGARLNMTDTTLSGSGSLAGGLMDLRQTWNTTGVPTAIKLNVTNTASGTGSNLMDLQVGGTSKFNVGVSGNIGIGIASPAAPLQLVASRATMAFGSTGLTGSIPFTDTASLGAWASGQTVGVINQAGQANGGLVFQGYTNSGSVSAFSLQGMMGSSSPTAAAVAIQGWKTDGSTGRTAMTTTDPVLSVQAGNGTAFMTALASGNIGIGTTAPATKLHVVGTTGTPEVLRIANEGSSTHTTFNFYNANDNPASYRNIFSAYESRGSLASPAALVNGDQIFTITGVGHDGTAYKTNSSLDFIVDGAVSTNVVPIALVYKGTATSSARAELFRIGSNGKVGINGVATNMLSVVGLAGDTTVMNIGTTSGNNCSFSTSTGAWSCASDIRLKHDVLSISSSEALTKLTALNPVTFRYNWQTQDEAPIAGFVAQEFETVFPDLVHTDEATGYKSLSYAPLMPYAIKAIQELDIQIHAITPDTLDATASAKIKAFLNDVANNVINIKDLFATTVHVEKGLEIKDQATGTIYCVVIQNGDWVKTPGTCDAPTGPVVPAAAPVVPVPAPDPAVVPPTPTPTADPVPAPDPNTVDTGTSQ